MQNTRKTKYKMVAGALVGVAVLGVVAIATGSVTRAAENIDFNVHVNDSMGMEISGISQGGIKLTLDPANSAVQTGTARITVGSSSGYRLNVTADGTDLVMQGEDATDDVVPTLEAAVAEADFPANHWGYRLGNSGNFSPFEPGEINSSEGAVNADVTDFVFAAKADYETAPGTYALTLNFAITPYVNTITMQDLDPTLCVTGEPTVVTDSRDGQSYTVQRLADGKCWMMTNLNLGATTLTATQLDDTNTHITNGSTIAAATFKAWDRSTAGTSQTYEAPRFSLVSGNDSTNGMPYGTLYNYCAASAETYCYAEGAGTGNATSDLCPKGWRLPTSGSSGEFQTLYSNSSYNTNAKMRNPISAGGAAFTLSGYFDDGSPTSQGSNGYFWSSTRYDGNYMYNLNLAGSGVNPANSGNRYLGFSIRCVLQ